MASCASYRQNIMFQVGESDVLMKNEASLTEKNYVIQKNELLSLEVYTKNGERLIDPDKYLSKDNPVATTPTEGPEVKSYLVDQTGLTKFPMIDPVHLEGLTLLQAEGVLQDAYTKFYQTPFVRVQYLNKRVIVLGAPGGQVIPLTNQNTRLTEVLALAKGVGNEAKAYNIRVLRGDTAFVADFSTFSGYKKSNIIIEPGDIVYVEPIRRPISEGLRDYGPVLSILTSLTTLVIVIIGL
jgi:polysaccharide export outer membrane protein